MGSMFESYLKSRRQRVFRQFLKLLQIFLPFSGELLTPPCSQQGAKSSQRCLIIKQSPGVLTQHGGMKLIGSRKTPRGRNGVKIPPALTTIPKILNVTLIPKTLILEIIVESLVLTVKIFK